MQVHQHEIDSFFSSVDTEIFWREIAIVQRKRAEQQLWSDLFFHSIDPQVGF